MLAQPRGALWSAVHRTGRFAIALFIAASAAVATAQERGVPTTQPITIPSSATQPTVAVPESRSATSAPVDRQEIAPTVAPDVWLRVRGNNVNIRSRHDINSTVLMQVSRDVVLRSVGREGDFHRILPPRGSFSLVAAEYVQLQGEDRGIVNVSTSLKVRAGGPAVTIDPLLREWQVTLDPGAVVEVLGREGDWLRIVPPGGVFYYVHSDFVEPISEAEAQRLMDTAPQPDYVEPAPSEPAARGDQGAAQPPTGSTAPTGTPAEQLVQIENMILAEARRPLPDQTWPPLIELLKPIAQQSQDLQTASAAASWMRRLDERMHMRAAKSESPALQPPATHAPTPAPAPAESGPPRPFDAQGILKPTFVLPAGEFGLRYKLEDPVSGRVVAYLEIPAALGVDLKSVMNRYVGVRGTVFRDEKQDVSILRASSLVAIAQPAPASGTPRPGL